MFKNTFGFDTYTGTSGNNLYVHTGGADYITDYTYEESGRQDTIVLTDSTILKATIDGRRGYHHAGEGTITVKNAKDKALRIAENGNLESVEARIYGYYNYDERTDNVGNRTGLKAIERVPAGNLQSTD